MGGWTDLPLTRRGCIQASTLATRLAHEPPPEAVYSSPLQRAVSTAVILAQRLSDKRVTLEPGVREIGCGSVDGLPIGWVQERFPLAWTTNLQQADPDFRWPGGESYREFRRRVVEAFRRIARTNPDRRVLIVTHAGVISQLIGWSRGDSAARWEAFRPRNASVTELRWHPQGPELVRFDDCGSSE
jgi:broad specificity phosphatase PhoE